MAKQNDLFYRPNIKAPVKEANIVGTTDKVASDALNQLNAAIAANPDLGDPKVYQSINELADAALRGENGTTTAIDALIEQFAKHEKNATLVKERLLFLIDLMIRDMNGDVSEAPEIVKRYIQDLTGIDVNNPDSSTLEPETISCIMRVAGITDPLKNSKQLTLDDTQATAMEKVNSTLGSISKLNIAQFGLMLLVIVLKLCFVIMVHYTVGFVCGFFKDKIVIGIDKKIMKVRLKVKWKIGAKIAKLFGIIEKKLLGLPFIGYKCSRNGQAPLCDANSDPSDVKINVVTCCTMEPIFFNSDQTNPTHSFNVNSCFKAWLESQLNPTTSGVRGTICGGSCKSGELALSDGDVSVDPVKSSEKDDSEDDSNTFRNMFSGMSKSQLEETLETLNSQYDQLTETKDNATAVYNAQMAAPDAPLPPLTEKELKKLHTTEAERQATYARQCKERRERLTVEYESLNSVYEHQLEESESGLDGSLGDKISYVTDLLFMSKGDKEAGDYLPDLPDEPVINPDACEPTNTEQAKAGVIADFLIANTESKSGLTDPANVSVCSQGIAKADAAVSLSQQVQSSLNSAKTHTYTGNPSGLGDCFGYTDDSNYAKYRQMSAKDRENAITADLQKAISDKAAQLQSDNTDSGTAIGSNSIYGYDGSGNELTDILGIADKVTTSLIDAADDIVTKVAGCMRWLSSRQLCCIIYILVFIVSIAKVFSKGSDYTLCRKKCKTCSGSGKIIDGNGKSATCPDCKGSGYGKDLMSSAEMVREFMHVQWAKEAGRNSNIQALVALLKIIKQIVDIFVRKNKRALLLSGLSLPLSEMFQLIKTTIAAALTEFLDAVFGPLDMALTSALGIPEIRNMMNNECPILPPIIKWLQCMLNGMKFGIITSFMQLFDANVQDIVIISDLLLCRQRMTFLTSLSTLLDSLIKLITGLKDCYDPGTLVDYIIEDVKEDQYTKYSELLSLLGTESNVNMFNACVSGSVCGNTVTFSDAEISDLEANPGTFNKGLGSELSAIIDQYNREQDISPLKVTYVTKKGTGKSKLSSTAGEDPSIVIPTYSDFKKELEDVSGVTMSAMKESMNEIYSILSGDSEHKKA